MNAFKLLLHSPAFWTALFSVIGLTVLKYALIPEDIWNAILALMVAIVTILTADGASESFARGLVKGMRETLIDIRQEENKRQFNMEDKG